MPPTARNKTPLKKPASTKRQTDDNQNQYAVLSDTDPKAPVITDAPNHHHHVPNKDNKHHTPATNEDTNERFESIEQTISKIETRQAIAEDTCHHILQVMHDRFDALDKKLKATKNPTLTHSTQPTSTWSTIVRGKPNKINLLIKTYSTINR